MVNQNENQNEFVLVLGPHNENRLRFCSSGESYQNEFVLVFVLVNHKDRNIAKMKTKPLVFVLEAVIRISLRLSYRAETIIGTARAAHLRPNFGGS